VISADTMKRSVLRALFFFSVERSDMELLESINILLKSRITHHPALLPYSTDH
jgi:hypothetical protein